MFTSDKRLLALIKGPTRRSRPKGPARPARLRPVAALGKSSAGRRDGRRRITGARTTSCPRANANGDSERPARSRGLQIRHQGGRTARSRACRRRRGRSDRPVTGIRLQAQDAVQIGFRQNALGEAAHRRAREGRGPDGGDGRQNAGRKKDKAALSLQGQHSRYSGGDLIAP